MTASIDSCKLCDERLIVFDTTSLDQKVIDYNGARVIGRKFPTLSSPENAIEQSVTNQRLFIFGGYNTMYKFINDKGYFMYDIKDNEMFKIDVGPEYEELLQRSQHTVNTAKVPITDKRIREWSEANGLP